MSNLRWCNHRVTSRFILNTVAVLLFVPEIAAAPVSSFDEIAYWVGNGGNRAALAIDWFEDSTDKPALVWGFRWDGAATGQTMLSAVIAADPRLFAKSGGAGGLGSALYGLGYDDGDGAFSLDDDTQFDEFGFAQSATPADGSVAIDLDDDYKEGWFSGFWNYGLSAGNPYSGGSWQESTAGMSTRTLHDGDWDSWTFSETFDFEAFAAAPSAAEPPTSGDNADFNGDGVIDGSDFLAWQRGFGTIGGEGLEQGDANGDGLVDAADLNAWSTAYGTGAAPPSSIALATVVPEPATVGLVVASLMTASVARRGSLRNGVVAWK
jgi:hypothetical protein